MHAVKKVGHRRRPSRSSIMGWLGLVLPLSLWGCGGALPGGGTGGGGPNGGTSGGMQPVVTAQIQGLSIGRTLSVRDAPISVLYFITGTPDSVSGLFVKVADTNPESPPTGDPVVVAQNLPLSGPDARFFFDPAVAGVGFFRVGVRVMDGADVIDALSTGVLNVQGLPTPMFVRPAESFLDVPRGDTAGVKVSFDTGVPVGNVEWRLFFLSLSSGDSPSDPPDVVGTQIATGSGNSAQRTFVTADLAPGEYELGLSVTDTGRSVAEEVRAGDVGRIVTILGPTIRITSEIAPPP